MRDAALRRMRGTQDGDLAVVPAKAGTHSHGCHFIGEGVGHGSKQQLLRGMGPRFREDDARRRLPTTNTSHRHLAVAHRGAGGEAFGGLDDGVGVDAVVAIEVADRAGLAEMLDAERFDPVTAHAAEPA